MKTKVYQIKGNSINAEARTLEAVLTERMVDRDSEVIEPEGAMLENFLKNPVMLWGHNASIPPIGLWTDVSVSKERVEAKAQFMPQGRSALADEVFAAFSIGALRSFSIGFDPKEYSEDPVMEGQKGLTITKWELMEASAVAVPANTGALVKTFDLMSRAKPDLFKRHTTGLTEAWDLISKVLKRINSGEEVNPAEKAVVEALLYEAQASAHILTPELSGKAVSDLSAIRKDLGLDK